MRGKGEAATVAATNESPQLLQRIEIVGDRRRVHDAAFRAEVVAASCVPGVRVQEVAERHGICPSLVYRWRRAAAAMDGSQPRLLPLRIVGEPAPVQAAPQAPGSRSPARGRASGLIEIELAGGERVRVDEAVSLAALRRVLAVLRG